MPFRREIPRDLFNDANLLKCYGQIYIALETAQAPDAELEHDGAAFDIQRDDGDGSTWVGNVTLKVRRKPVRLFRPANSKYRWPLYFFDNEGDEVEVFADDGTFSQEMLNFLRQP